MRGYDSRIGTRIRAARLRRGYSLNELAARSKTAKSTLSEIENGKKDMSVTKLVLIANALKVPPSDLLS